MNDEESTEPDKDDDFDSQLDLKHLNHKNRNRFGNV